MPPTYDQAYGQLGGIYDPQTQLVQSQLNDLPAQQQAQQSALDQAKVNAFKDIDTSANSKGILFSGFSPDQQAQYVGTKYLPAVANLTSTFANNKNTLLSKINEINAQRSTQAQGIVSSAQKNAQDLAYKQAQLQISASKGGSGGLTAGQTKQALQQHIVSNFAGNVGKDQKVSNETWAGALNDYIAGGLGDVRSFWKTYGQYVNPNYKSSYAGYAQR